MKIRAIYKNTCPNCNSDISDLRLRKGLPCSKCYRFRDHYCKHVESLKKLRSYCEFKDELENFISFFKSKIAEPWSLQIAWAKRVLLGRSFALLAPTGVGKTTFGIVVAQYLKGKRYLILPSRLLVEQIAEKLNALAYHSKMKKKEREEVKERIKKGDFEILVTTSMFLWKNFDILRKNTFDFIFVDDVDSVLKRDKNVDRLLYLLGYSQEEIELALELIKLKSNWEKNKTKIEELEKKIRKNKGLLLVSSATTRVKSKRVKLFRELLDFEVGATFLTLRNIEDIYLKEGDIIELIRKLGSGCLLFTLSKEEVDKWVRKLNLAKIKAVSYENFGEFEQGKASVAVGIANVKNPLARGIDLPHLIRYVIFTGVPKFKLRLSVEDKSKLFPLLVNLRELMEKEEREKVDRFIYQLKGKKANIEEIKKFLEQKLADKSFIDKIKKSKEITLAYENNELSIIIADVASYIQASGRCSRLFPGGISKGASFLFVDDEKAFNNLKKRIRWYYEDIDFKPIENINIKELMEEIDKDREKIRKCREGKATKEEKEFIKSALVIVESPTKAKTISNFFGRASKRKINNLTFYETNTGEYSLTLAYTQGHFFDLTKENIGYHGVMVNERITPVYEKIKEGIVEALQELCKEVDIIFIATDPDIEGEKIAYDAYCNLKPFVSDIKRAEFHEITRKAFLQALREPRSIDENLVEAQLVRRILDRWVGFELSQRLWRKFKDVHLSAGRVQTPVLGWVIERSKQARKRIPLTKIKLSFGEFSFEEKLSPKEAEIKILDERLEVLSPPPPFSTEAMIREANARLRFGVEKTMSIAQELFEHGLITYHRTDSIRVSDVGLKVARQYIDERYKNLFKPRRWGEGGAHECIRPTRAIDAEELKNMTFAGVYNLTKEHIALYNLIFTRFIASQMKEAKVKKIRFKVLPFKEEKEAITEIVEPGFISFSVMKAFVTEIKEGRYRVMEVKQYSKPKVSLFTQGSLVEEMKLRGLGRPSTYATIVQTLLNRGYVMERKGYLVPTKKGIIIYNFLVKNFEKYVSESFTRELEEMMERVEKGEEDYQRILKSCAKFIY